jgi:hypothetical protein
MPSFLPLLKPQFSKMAKKRYPDVPSMARNPSLEEEFTRNAEYLRLRLEFEELRRLLLRHIDSQLQDDPATLPAYNFRDNLEIADVSLFGFDRPIK